MSLTAPSRSTAPHGSVSLLVDDDAILVALHGALDESAHRDVADLVDDLRARRIEPGAMPVRVLAAGVTALDLTGIWLLVELRRWARGHEVALVEPSAAVLSALVLHGLTASFPRQVAA